MSNSQAPTCQDCGGTRLRIFRACGYKKVRCQDCCKVHSIGILTGTRTTEKVEMTPYGMAAKKTTERTHAPGNTKVMDYEKQYKQDEPWEEVHNDDEY